MSVLVRKYEVDVQARGVLGRAWEPWGGSRVVGWKRWGPVETDNHYTDRAHSAGFHL